MIVFPAIDIINSKVVRLSEGDYGKATNYSVSPLQAAENFYKCGATHMHVVDLDGAKSGNADNAKTIEQIAKLLNMFIEVGGGIRSEEQIKKYLDCGVKRVILGTVAAKNIDFVVNAVAKFGDAVSVGVDAKDGKVAVNGWKEVTKIDSVQFCKDLRDIGVNHVIYTDISRDGMLKGTNLDIYKVLCQIEKLKITASGGLSFLDEFFKLNSMGIYGAIVGKALYEGVLDLKEVIAASGVRNAG